MTDRSITPPPELVQQWMNEIYDEGDASVHFFDRALAARAAQWGADQELEACCALLEVSDDNAREYLQSARRPKQQSLKEQALEKLQELRIDPEGGITHTGLDLIRRALEALPDD